VMVTFIGYFYFMQIFMTLCSNLNSVMSNYVYSAFKSEARGNDLYFQVTGDVFNFELVFPSMQVLTVDWFSLGWLMLIVLAIDISIYCRCTVQQLVLIWNFANHGIKHSDFAF